MTEARKNVARTSCSQLSFVTRLQPMGTWPSGKAGDCKSLTPGSNPGVPFETPRHNWR